MNILLINHYAGSPSLGMEYRPYYLAREWVNLGHQVTIVAASFSHLRKEQPQMETPLSEEVIDGIRYIWIKTPSYQGNGVKRFVNMAAFINGLYQNKKMLVDLAPDVVIASSTYPLDMYPASSIARECAARLVLEVHDLWPLSPMELGNMSKWHPFIVLMQQAENFAYANADKVVSILPNTKEYMQEHGLTPEKFAHVPNGIAINRELHPVADISREISAITGLREKYAKIVMYAGAHGVANALEVVIQAAALLRQQGIGFVFVGSGPEKATLQKVVEDQALDNVLFLPPVAKSSVHELLQAADILVISWRKSRLYRYGVSPNKIMDYMLAAKPILQAIEASNDIISAAQCGLTVVPESPEAMAEGIMQLIRKDSGELVRMGENAKNYVCKNHDYKVLVQKFTTAIS